MVRYLLITMAFFLLRNEAYSQLRYDSIPYQKVQINGLYTTVTKKELIQAYGKPQKITRYVSDANDDRWWEYHYGRTIMEVLADGRLYGFELRTPAFVFQYGEYKVRVGDSLSSLRKYFPGSYKWLIIEKSDILRVRCKGSDGYIHFESKNGIITSIYTWEEL